MRLQPQRQWECLMDKVCLRNLCPLLWHILDYFDLVWLREAVVRGSAPSDGCLDYDWLLAEACQNGQLLLAQFLVKKKHADPSARDNVALLLARSNSHFDVVSWLLHDTRVSASLRDGKSLLEWACREGHRSIVHVLMSIPLVDPSAGNNIAILVACGNGHVSVARMLMQDGRVDPSADRNAALVIARISGRREVEGLLLEDERVRRKDA